MFSVISAMFSRSFLAIHSLATVLNVSFSSTRAFARGDLLLMREIEASREQPASRVPPGSCVGQADLRP